MIFNRSPLILECFEMISVKQYHIISLFAHKHNLFHDFASGENYTKKTLQPTAPEADQGFGP